MNILTTAGRIGAVVLGFGISNVPLCDFLLGRGVEVEVRDAKTREALSGSVDVDAYEKRGVKFTLGEKYLDDIPAAVIFRTPGIRPDAGGIQDAVKRGAILTSEMELFYALCPAYKIAITGSDGKTTTTTLTHMILSAVLDKLGNGAKAVLGGNIGAPLLPQLYVLDDGDYAVAELSSFQLMTFPTSPRTAVITNVTPNHLNWHTGMEEYIEAKLRILGDGCEHAVLNYGCDITRAAVKRTRAAVTFFTAHDVEGIDSVDNIVRLIDDEIVLVRGGERILLLARKDIKLPGMHNVENYMAALAALYDVDGVPRDVMLECAREIARTFGGVEHRLEYVREIDDVTFYNGSIDSSPTRTAAALSALGDRKIVIICGGYDKHIPMRPLAEAVIAHGGVMHTVLTGATRDLIADAYGEAGIGQSDYTIVPDFDDAVREAYKRAKELGADTVLLSPACASFDAFANFEERGRHYKSLVNSL